MSFDAGTVKEIVSTDVNWYAKIPQKESNELCIFSVIFIKKL